MAEKNSSFRKNIIYPNFGRSFLFVAIFFLSPLIFFTDLTRNPYYFQITILNVFLIITFFDFVVFRFKCNFGFLKEGFINKILLVTILFFLITSIHSYFSHNDFFKPAILNEFVRIWLFTIVNCLIPFYLAQFISLDSDSNIPYWKYIIFVFFWGLCWSFFPFLKSVAGGEDLFSKFWDFYGGCLWIGGIWFLVINSKNINHVLLLHLAMITSIIASVYGVLQYFGIEFIWSRLINPYGRRAVSTFGNPNFISSYVLMIIPLAIYYFIRAQKASGRFFYSLTVISGIGMIFASLTRSSLIGLIVVIIFMFSFKEYRSFFSFSNKKSRIIIVFAFFLLLLWPDQNLKPVSFGVFARMGEGLKTVTSKISLSVKEDEIYPSFHQRLLIWSSAYNMFRENPILGKGWGSFELFYPYYQGDLVKKYPAIRSLRTHANNAHNEILEIISQTGIIGFGLALFFLFTFAYNFFRFFRLRGYEDRIFLVALFASILGMIVDNMLNVSLHFAVPAFLFWWLLGLFNKKISGLNFTEEFKYSRFRKIILVLFTIISFVGVYHWYNQFMREVYYFDGFKLMRRNNFAEAAKKLKQAYDYNSREVNNNYELANAYVRMDEYDKAIWAYKKALEANSGYDEIFFNMGIIQKKINKEKEAIKNLKTSMFINPLNKATYHALVDIYLRNPETYCDEAVETIDEIIKVYPYDTGLYNYTGYFLTRKKDYTHAKYYYEEGLKKNPLDNLLYENLKGVLNILGIKKSEVLDYANTCRELDRILFSRADEALKKISSLPEKFRDRDFIVYLKAKALFKMNNLEQAKALLIKLLEEREDFNDARYGLAVIYEKQGLFDEAKRQWLKILEYEPDNKRIKERIGE